MKQEIRGSKNQKRDWIGAFIFPPVFFVRFSQSGMNRENHALVGIKNNEEKYFFPETSSHPENWGGIDKQDDVKEKNGQDTFRLVITWGKK